MVISVAAAAFSRADVIVQGTYRTPHQEQLYIEPQGMIAIPEEDGGVLLLTDPNALSVATAGALTDNKGDIIRLEVFGGGAAISFAVEAQALAIAP